MKLLEDCLGAMLSPKPGSLGFPAAAAQSAYYPEPITPDEVKLVSDLMVQKGVGLENTRIVKKDDLNGGASKSTFHILQASVETDDEARVIGQLDSGGGAKVRLVRGDHSKELERVNEALAEAARHSANLTQENMIAKLRETFLTGDIEDYKESLRLWVQDTSPKVETMLGFIEAYRDPSGTRAEFEGVVAIWTMNSPKR